MIVNIQHSTMYSIIIIYAVLATILLRFFAVRCCIPLLWNDGSFACWLGSTTGSGFFRVDSNKFAESELLEESDTEGIGGMEDSMDLKEMAGNENGSGSTWSTCTRFLTSLACEILGLNRKLGAGREASNANCFFSIASLLAGDNWADELKRDWLVGKNIGIGGVAALLVNKWCSRFAIGVGGGDNELRDDNTSEPSGEWIESLIVLVRWR